MTSAAPIAFAPLNRPEDIVHAIQQTINALAAGLVDAATARTIFYGLQIASASLKNKKDAQPTGEAQAATLIAHEETIAHQQEEIESPCEEGPAIATAQLSETMVAAKEAETDSAPQAESHEQTLDTASLVKPPSDQPGTRTAEPYMSLHQRRCEAMRKYGPAGLRLPL